MPTVRAHSSSILVSLARWPYMLLNGRRWTYSWHYDPKDTLRVYDHIPFFEGDPLLSQLANVHGDTDIVYFGQALLRAIGPHTEVSSACSLYQFISANNRCPQHRAITELAGIAKGICQGKYSVNELCDCLDGLRVRIAPFLRITSLR